MLEDFQHIRGSMNKYDKEPDSLPSTMTFSSAFPETCKLDSVDQLHQNTLRDMNRNDCSLLPNSWKQPNVFEGFPISYPQVEEDLQIPSTNPPEAFDGMDCSYDIEDTSCGMLDPRLYQDSGYSSVVNTDFRPRADLAASNVLERANLSKPSHELHGFAERTERQESLYDVLSLHRSDVEMEGSNVPSSQKCLWCDRSSGPDGLCDICFTERTAYNFLGNA